MRTRSGGRYRAARVVVTAGAWLGLLGDLRLPLRPERNVVLWLRPRERPEQLSPVASPRIRDRGRPGSTTACPTSAARGSRWAPAAAAPGDPDTVDRTVRPEDEDPVRAFLAAAVPALDGPLEDGAVCLYTNTPDGHFVVDRHPRVPAVLFAGGTSGHGFKLASVLGEILAELATTGRVRPGRGLPARRPAARSRPAQRRAERRSAALSPASGSAPLRAPPGRPPDGSASAPGGASATPRAGRRSGPSPGRPRRRRGRRNRLGDVPQVDHLTVDGQAGDGEGRLVGEIARRLDRRPRRRRPPAGEPGGVRREGGREEVARGGAVGEAHRQPAGSAPSRAVAVRQAVSRAGRSTSSHGRPSGVVSPSSA